MWSTIILALLHIVKFIDRDKQLSMEDKKHYASLLRAQLSTFELLLIFYNAMSTYGIKKFKPLIDKYDLLQNMNITLAIKDCHKAIFERYC